MGKIVSAKCKECGYNFDKMFLGGGMLNFQKHCGYPALNKDQTEVVVRNYKNKVEEEKSNGFIFYDSKSLYDEESFTKSAVMQNFDTFLYNANYFCPKCRNYTLRFFMTGLWD